MTEAGLVKWFGFFFAINEALNMSLNLKNLVVFFIFLLSGCDSKNKNIIQPNFAITHVDRIMLQPQLYINKEVNVFGVLDVTGPYVRLIPNNTFKGLGGSIYKTMSLQLVKKA